MSYGLYLYKETISVGGRTMRLEIWEKDYTGASAEIEAMGTPPFTISLDNSGGKVETPLIKTNATIIIKDTGQIDYDTLFTPDATKYKVIIKVTGVDYWYGFLTPDSFSQALSYKSDIILTARDNLGMLASFRYEREGTRATMRTILNEAMTLISFGNTLEYRQIKTSGTTNILDGYIRADKYIGGTWADAVEEILHDCGLQMRFIGGAKYAVYDIGDIASLGTTLATQSFQFINKSGNKEIVPAVKDIKLSQNYGSIDNSYDGVLNADDYSLRAVRAVTQPTNQYILQPETYNINYYDPSLGQTIWGGLAGTQGMINPNEWNEAPSTIMITGDLYTLTTYRQPISYSQIMPITESNVEIKMKVSNLVKYPSVIEGKAIWKDLFFMFLSDSRTSIYWSGAHYQIRLRYNIFLVSATKTYVMREQWEEFTDTNPSVGTYLTFLLPSGGSDGGVPIFKDYNARDEEITFNIQTIPEDGVLQIAFYPYEIVGQFVQEYPSVVPQDIKNNIPLTYPILIKDVTIKYPAAEIGGLDSQAIISANHNISLDVNLNLGQVPSGVGDSATMQGGIYSNGANYYKALGNFFRTAGTEYHLSELIGREIVNIYKVQREKLSGQIINSTNYTALPSFEKTFTANGKLYALNFGSLDFANEVMQVELVEVEAYETEDFTFVEAAIDTGGGTNLGSGDTTFLQWSAAGNATRIYSLDTATEAEQGGAYVVIDKIGLAAAKKVALLDLLVDAYTKTESDAKYLGITAKAADSELLDNHDSTYFATATGGSGYIQNQIASAQTADYWISGKAKMGTLVLPTSATLASGEVGLYTTESGFSGELPSGAGSVTSVGLSMPTGFSVANSPITESGTLTVTFASGYFIPTTTQWATKLDTSLKGSINGLAELDENGFVKNTQLPSYVDDVIEVDNFAALPATGESGKIYVTLDTNKTYRWSGTAYVLISESLALGETSSTAYRGDRGKIAYDHSQSSGNPHGTTAAQVGAATTIHTHTSSAPANDLVASIPNYSGYSFVTGASAIGKYDAYSVIITFGTEATRGLQLMHTVNNNGYYLRDTYDETSAANFYTLWHSGNSNLTSVNWSAAKLTSTTLLLPQSAPSLTSGEMAIYGLESGFSGETPSGAGSVTSISMVVPTGLSVSPETITESGTFTISYASGYSIPTTAKQTEWDNAYTLRHNAVTLGTANGLSLLTQELSLGLASASANGALSSTDWSTFNGKQAALNGTGFVKISGTTISYDNSSYLTGNQTITLSGIITGSGTTAITTAIADGALSIAKTSGLQTALDAKMATASYPDLVAIEALTETSGFLKKTAANTWALDTNSYALISGATTQDFQAKNLTLAGTLTGAISITVSQTSPIVTITSTSGTANSSLVLGNIAGFEGASAEGTKVYYSGSTGNSYFDSYYSTGSIILRTNISGGSPKLFTFAASGAVTLPSTVTMLENINTNFRVPKVAPTSPTSGEYYFYVVE